MTKRYIPTVEVDDQSKKLCRSELRDALESLASALNRAQKARDKIYEHCRAVYGVTPADIDNDAFIDANDGGNGGCAAMTPEEFDASMKECMQIMGMDVPE